MTSKYFRVTTDFFTVIFKFHLQKYIIIKTLQMSLNIKIIKKYSQVLYDQAIKTGIENQVLEQTVSLKKIMLNSSTIMQALCSPIIEKNIKKKIVDLVALKLKFSQVTTNFLHVIIKNARYHLVPEISDELSKIIAKSQNIYDVKVTFPHLPHQKEIDAINTFLKSVVSKKMKITTNVDPSLIGGAIIEYDNNIIDCSIRKVLDKIIKKNT